MRESTATMRATLSQRVSTRARLALALLIALPLSLALAHPAYAHTQLLKSDPEQGTSLDAAPEKVTLTFSQKIDERFVNVSMVVGTAKPAPLELTVDGRDVIATVPAEMADAAPATDVVDGSVPWKVVYRVTSQDGHPVSGEVAFKVAASEAAPSQTPTTDATSDPTSDPTSDATPTPTADPSIQPSADPTTGTAAEKSTGSGGTAVMVGIGLAAIAAVVATFFVLRRGRPGRS